jgi:acyl-CoA thioesterase
MRFDASLREGWTPRGEGWEHTLPEGWMQGRSVFGGLTAAMAASLAAREVDDGRRLRTMSIQLLRPSVPGPVLGSTRALREGKTTRFVESRLRQDDGEVAVASLCFVRPRRGSVRVPAPAPSARPDPEDAREMPYLEGITPQFTRQIAMRFASGDRPFSGAAAARFTGFCRFRGDGGDEEGLLGLLDAWPCPSLSLLSAPAFASTVSWTAHLIHVPTDFAGWFYYEYETVVGAEGFHTAVGRLYGPDGALAAWSEQLVAVFD